MKCKKCGKECLESELINGLCKDCIEKYGEKLLNKNKNNNFFKDRKNIVILVLSLIIFIILMSIATVFILHNIKTSKKIDASNYSYIELVNMFEEKGYKFKLYYQNSRYISTIYIILDNEAEGITIQRIYNNVTGNMMTFDDDSINDEMADLIDTSKNNTPKKEQQYEAFENWLKKYNITKYQVSNMLDTYYDLHKDEAEDLRAIENELLNSNI